MGRFAHSHSMYSSRNASQTICSFSCIASVTISSPLASGVGVVGVSSSPLLAVCWSLFSMSTSSALSSRFLFRERRIDIWRTFTPLGVFDYAQQYCETSSWTFVTGWWSLAGTWLTKRSLNLHRFLNSVNNSLGMTPTTTTAIPSTPTIQHV